MVYPIRQRLADYVRCKNGAAGSVGELQDMIIMFIEMVELVVDVDYDVSTVRLDALGHIVNEESYCRGDANETIVTVRI